MLEDILLRTFFYVTYVSIILFLYLSYRSGLLADLFSTLKKNFLFFMLLFGLGLWLSLSNSPFTPLVFFDEQAFVIHAQNVIENGAIGECKFDENGICLKYVTAPIGLGTPAIYSFLYILDFHDFYVRISVLNLIFYLLNSLLIFLVANKLFDNINIASLSSLFVIVFPLNFEFSTTAMPHILSSSFLLFAIYFLGGIVNDKSTKKNYKDKFVFLSLILSVVLLSTIRVEFTILMLILVLLHLFNPRINGKVVFSSKFTDFSNERTSIKILREVTKFIFVLSLLAAIPYIKLKLAEPYLFGISVFSLNFLKEFFLNGEIALLTLFFVFFLFVSRFPSKIKKSLKNSKPVASVLAIFFVFLLFFSFFSFDPSYRHLIPLLPLFLIFVAAGIYFFVALIFKNRKVVALSSFAIVLSLSSILIPSGFEEKNSIILETRDESKFVDFLKEETLTKILERDLTSEDYFYFPSNYLCRIDRINNCIDGSGSDVERVLENGNVFYVDNVFADLSSSPFNNTTYFEAELMENSENFDFKIYKIKKLKS